MNIEWKKIVGLKRGSTGEAVKMLQTVLDDIGHHLVIDGIFGPATEAAYMAAVKEITAAGLIKKLPITEICADFLKAFWTAAKKPKKEEVYSVLTRILQIAEAEMTAGAREIGGNNMGPWVRKYTNGKEGAKWPWCVAFATWCVLQAFAPDKSPIKERYSSSRLATEGKNNKWYTEDITKVYPGCLFIIKGGTTGYQHTGIVKAVDPKKGVILTIEGNSRLSGETRGDRVCSKYRSIKNMGFILIPNSLGILV